MEQLRGETLSGICLIWQSVELKFNGAILRFLVLPGLRVEDQVIEETNSRYWSTLRGFIGKQVTSVEQNSSYLVRLTFTEHCEVYLKSSAVPDCTGERMHYVRAYNAPVEVW